jgi:hypothetical protein
MDPLLSRVEPLTDNQRVIVELKKTGDLFFKILSEKLLDP